MVLLHELAHIRRYDNLVNLLQRTVEGMLFFHPAVWILSHWVRLEREACCDSLVVAHTGQPRQYAQLLLTLAEAARGGSPELATAMAEPPPAGRIRQILKLEDEKMLVSRRTVGMVALGLLVSMTLVACYRPSRTAAEVRENAAREKAQRLVKLVQGTSALESQSVEPEVVQEMVARTVHELLAGPNRNLWAS